MITTWFYEFSDDLYHYFLYRVGIAEAEDLVQEVFIRAMNGFEGYKEEASPKTWLYTIGRNVATDAIKKKQKFPFSFLHKEVETPSQSLEEDFLIYEEKITIYRAIQTLKPSYRDVVILRGIKEISVQETATILGWTENKVRSTYYRAKLSLQTKLGGEFNE